jgi:predicted RNA-binding Zn-ribbon protein involved in translation (DUF1610 family)
MENKQFQCQHCDKLFTSDAALRKHRSRDHSDKIRVISEEEKKFECPECGNKFKLKQHLVVHLEKNRCEDKEA